jgi:hypothetical protein
MYGAFILHVRLEQVKGLTDTLQAGTWTARRTPNHPSLLCKSTWNIKTLSPRHTVPTEAKTKTRLGHSASQCVPRFLSMSPVNRPSTSRRVRNSTPAITVIIAPRDRPPAPRTALSTVQRGHVPALQGLRRAEMQLVQDVAEVRALR